MANRHKLNELDPVNFTDDPADNADLVHEYEDVRTYSWDEFEKAPDSPGYINWSEDDEDTVEREVARATRERVAAASLDYL